MGSDSEAEKSLKEKKKLMSLAPIAKPLAGKKLSKKILKLVRKAAESKCLKRGVKEVVKSIRRNHKGFLCSVLRVSPDTDPSHRDRSVSVPAELAAETATVNHDANSMLFCAREADIPYIYVSSKEELATAGVTKRPTCCVLVMTKPTKGELGQEVQEKLQSEYDQVVSDVKELASSLF